MASVVVTTDTTINNIFHKQTTREIDSVDNVQFPRIFRETPRDEDHKDEMIRELESKLQNNSPEETPIFTTALPPLLTSRANAERLKEQNNNYNVRGATSTDQPEEIGAIVVAVKHSDMDVVAANKDQVKIDYFQEMVDMHRDALSSSFG
jgi:hypothetical protein